MSEIERLLAEHCPEGVEYRSLGDVGTFIRGNGLQKSDLLSEGFPAIHYGQIHTVYGTTTDKTVSFVDSSFAARLRQARSGDLIIATTSEDDAAVAKAVAWTGKSDVAVSGDAYIYRHSMDPAFVSYWFQTAAFQSQKRRHVTGTKVRRVSGDNLARIRIPAPPLEVQREIVAILDTMERLEAELEAELEARRRQYAYYRDALLTFNEAGGVRWVPLDEIADFKYGYTAKASDSGDVRFIRITDINESGKLNISGAKYVEDGPVTRDYRVAPGDLLMARTGGTFGKTMLYTADKAAVYASFLIRIRFPSDTLLPAFYWHFAQSDLYWSQANALVSRGGQPQFNANSLRLVKVPVPPMAEQHRVVALLDAFDVLLNDLSSGLPAEIAARRQQYEYYRDRLLSFEELAA